MKNAVGVCLCKAVTVTFPLQEEVFDACHCGMCRKWVGGPFLTVHGGTEGIKFKGEEFISRFASSDWAERGFCTKCGTHLFYCLKGKGMYAFPLGLIENSESFKFHLQIFVDKKSAQYNFAEKTEQMTEAQVFAKYT